MVGVADNLRSAVVKIISIRRAPNFYQPWSPHVQQTSIGTGCVLRDGNILTAAHLVSGAKSIQIQCSDDSRRFDANLVYIDHDSDLALLTSNHVFDASLELGIGNNPPLNSEITIVGYPDKGGHISVIAGRVIRIATTTYNYSQRDLLALETDARLAAGFSGGPAFLDGRLIGLAIQAIQDSPGAFGHVVPSGVIRRFLRDCADGYVDGVPDLGIYWQRIDSDALRRYLHAPPQGGILVTRVLFGSSADGLLREGDVITHISGVSIGSDGSILVPGGIRVSYTCLIDGCVVGDAVKVRVMRRGLEVELNVPLKKYVSLVAPPHKYENPPYYIEAGLVFMPLSFEYMMTWGLKNVHFRLKHLYYDVLPTSERSEIVLLAEVLSHPATLPYCGIHAAIVESVNGKIISSMRDIPTAFMHPVDGFHVVKIDYHGPRDPSIESTLSFGTHVVIDASTSRAVTESVLKDHGIASRCSADLLSS